LLILDLLLPLTAFQVISSQDKLMFNILSAKVLGVKQAFDFLKCINLSFINLLASISLVPGSGPEMAS
jgi:hypothetical protein